MLFKLFLYIFGIIDKHFFTYKVIAVFFSEQFFNEKINF